MTEAGGINVRGKFKPFVVTDISLQGYAWKLFIRDRTSTNGLVFVDLNAGIPIGRIGITYVEVLRKNRR